MSDRFFARSGAPATAFAVVAALLVAAPAPLAGQVAPSATPTRSNAAAAKPLRTAEGQPDLQGYWTTIGFTPLERPKEFAGQEFLTKEELAEFFKKAVQESSEQTFEHPEGTPVYDATIWGLDPSQQGAKPNLRTSIVVDPRDGRLPALTPEAEKRRAAQRATAASRQPAPGEGYFWGGAWGRYPAGPEDASLGLRCLYFGGGNPPLLAGNYNNTYHIVQSVGHVAILYERNVLRVIPLDGSPHPPAHLRQWYGDSRGRWEGETLVVETTNFTNRTSFRGSSENMRVVERFTRVDADTIRYQFTVDDPATWVRPWSGELPITRIEGPTFEYACHEGNRGLMNILSVARAKDKAAAEAPNKTSR